MDSEHIRDGFWWIVKSAIQIAIMLIVAAPVGTLAQSTEHPAANNKLPATDAAKIGDALRAGPPFITQHATILDWPSTEGGEYRVLRKGTNEWSCLPAFPGYPHDEPGCFDPAFMSWVKQSLGGRRVIAGWLRCSLVEAFAIDLISATTANASISAMSIEEIIGGPRLQAN